MNFRSISYMIDLDGSTLRLEDVVAVAKSAEPVRIASSALKNMDYSRRRVDEAMSVRNRSMR